MGTAPSLTDPSLNRIAEPLIEATGNGGAKVRLIRVCRDLADYPIPAFTDPQRESAVWYHFFNLVLMVQSGNHAAALSNARFVATHFPRPDLSRDWWWLDRAKAYAPLGLPLGTRV